MAPPPHSDGYFTSGLLSDEAKVNSLLEDLRTNADAQALDARELKAIAAAAEVDLARYNTDIARAEIALKLRCPIRLLPTELLIDILRLCVDDVPLAPRRFESNLDRFGRRRWIILSTVCKHWQTIIFGTASIWAKISLQFIPPSKDLLAKMLIKRALQRSGDALLDVSVRMDVQYDADFDDVLPLRRHSVSLLALHSKRWRIFIFDFHPQEFQDLQRIHHRLPNLEELHLHFRSAKNRRQTWAEEVRMIRECTLFEDAPSLRRISVEDMSPVLPWSQLQSFHALLTESNTEMQNSVALIAHFSASCKFSFIGLEPTKAHWVPGVVFRSEVYSLKAGFYFEEKMPGRPRGGLDGLLSHLELPRLTWLEFNAERSGTLAWDAHAFASFIAASGSPLLTTLRLFDVLLTTSQLLAALACTPHLEELAIEDVDIHHSPALITTSLLTQLSAVHEGKFRVIPALHRFYMRATFLDMDLHVLSGLLHLRAKTPSASDLPVFKCRISVLVTRANKFDEMCEVLKDVVDDEEMDVILDSDADFWSP
uniref:F-box domain-containing protein n=1 Tax=Mycena chlorophos TaxID=658473 RepID=A0ABQ0L7K0_MYCCL|nr:predicted protein [Mycena chlorophos]